MRCTPTKQQVLQIETTAGFQKKCGVTPAISGGQILAIRWMALLWEFETFLDPSKSEFRATLQMFISHVGIRDFNDYIFVGDIFGRVKLLAVYMGCHHGFYITIQFPAP